MSKKSKKMKQPKVRSRVIITWCNGWTLTDDDAPKMKLSQVYKIRDVMRLALPLHPTASVMYTEEDLNELPGDVHPVKMVGEWRLPQEDGWTWGWTIIVKTPCSHHQEDEPVPVPPAPEPVAPEAAAVKQPEDHKPPAKKAPAAAAKKAPAKTPAGA